jgi:hypothetical protein
MTVQNGKTNAVQKTYRGITDNEAAMVGASRTAAGCPNSNLL